MAKNRCSIVANPNGAAWGFAQGVLDYLKRREAVVNKTEREAFQARVNSHLQLPSHDRYQALQVASAIYEAQNNGNGSRFYPNPLLVTTFPGGEPKTVISKSVEGADCVFIHDSNLYPPDWFTQLDLANDAMRNSSPARVINVLPYFLFARQERKDEPRTCNSAKRVCHLMDYPNTRVLTVDIHNEAIGGFVDSSTLANLPSYPVVVKYLKQNYPGFLNRLVVHGTLDDDETAYIKGPLDDPDNLIVQGPDAGSGKRIRKYAKALGCGISLVDKERTVTGALGISCGILGDVRGKNVLQVDDMYSTGGTSIGGAVAAKNNGANEVWLYATHGVLAKGFEKIVEVCDKMLVGNTLALSKEFHEHPKCVVIPFEDYIGEAIFRINMGGMSISDMYDLKKIAL